METNAIVVAILISICSGVNLDLEYEGEDRLTTDPGPSL